MRNKIRLTESELITLISRIISEGFHYPSIYTALKDEKGKSILVYLYETDEDKNITENIKNNKYRYATAVTNNIDIVQEVKEKIGKHLPLPAVVEIEVNDGEFPIKNGQVYDRTVDYISKPAAQNESYRRSRNTLTESDMRRLTRRILK
jgi:hypothetical protein